MYHLKTILGSLVASLFALGGPALADPGKSGKTGQPAAEVQALHRLVGEWRGTTAFTAGSQKGETPLTVSCRPVAKGFGVSCQVLVSNLPGGRTIEETDLFGWDPSERRYHWFAVTSEGDTHDHVAPPPAGDTLIFARAGFRDGKPTHEIIKLRVSGDGKRMEYRNDCMVDAEPQVRVAGTLARK
jgi:hypothetical protein